MDATVSLGQLIVTVVVTVLGSSGLFAFIQFLINRRDKKDDKLKEFQKSLSEMEVKMEKRDEKVYEAIHKLSDDTERRYVIQCRVQILRANDELRKGDLHSYEYFRQLHHDITEYEHYCTNHPEFKNNEAVNSIEYINRVYQECLDNNTFLI